MALQRLQEEKELEQPLLCWACQPLCSRNRRGEKATQGDFAHRHFDISCLADPVRARIRCLPLSQQGLLNQVPYLQSILSTAEPGFVCTFSPHIQQVSSSLHDLLRKTLQGICLALLVCVVSLHSVLSPGVQLFCVLHGLF